MQITAFMDYNHGTESRIKSFTIPLAMPDYSGFPIVLVLFEDKSKMKSWPVHRCEVLNSRFLSRSSAVRLSSGFAAVADLAILFKRIIKFLNAISSEMVA